MKIKELQKGVNEKQSLLQVCDVIKSEPDKAEKIILIEQICEFNILYFRPCNGI